MDVTVQWVRTSWTKQSRGGAAAALRNAAPVGFVLPHGVAPLAHTVRMQERDDFTLFALPPRRRRPPAVRPAPGRWVRGAPTFHVDERGPLR
ncbi:hypothetical protein ACFYWX_32135 [Streptomyces sp. NPDC002888]|uniref:hypothetical protein n=1 Tax=Streptomyces sp. NPDC002888 TaxID=3364668 RepID=UPI00368179A6